MDIARQIGIGPQWLSVIINSPLFREELERMVEERDFAVSNRLESLSNEALDTIRDLMRDSRSDRLKLHAAEDILDRAGYSKIEKKMGLLVDAEAVIRELNHRKAERESCMEIDHG